MSRRNQTVPLFAAVLFAVDALLENLSLKAHRLVVRMDAVADRPKALREQRGKIEKQIDDLINKAESEERDLNAEETKTYNELFAKSTELRNRLQRLEARDQARADLAERKARDSGKLVGSDDGRVSEEARDLALAGWMMNQFPAMRDGVGEQHLAAAKELGIDLNADQWSIKLLKGRQAQRLKQAHDRGLNVYNALSSEVGSDGGYLRPSELITSLEVAMFSYGGMMEEAQVIRTSNANPLLWPTVNDTGNTGRQIGEAKAVGSATDPQFGLQRWGSFKITSDEILASYELLRDAEVVELGALIGELLGERIGRFVNTRCTTGSGANTIRGILTRSTLGITAASATAIADTELVRLVHKIDPALRGQGCKWMMHDNTLLAIRLLKDGNGQFIYRAGLDHGEPDRLLTYPIRINQDMPSALTTGQKPILFGLLKKYKIRQVNQIRLYRLTERHRENDQDAFLAFTEIDGDLLDPTNGGANAPVKHLVLA